MELILLNSRQLQISERAITNPANTQSSSEESHKEKRLCHDMKYSQELFLSKLLLELEVVFSGSFRCYKEVPLKMKKESPERCESPKK